MRIFLQENTGQKNSEYRHFLRIVIIPVLDIVRHQNISMNMIKDEDVMA